MTLLAIRCMYKFTHQVVALYFIPYHTLKLNVLGLNGSSKRTACTGYALADL